MLTKESLEELLRRLPNVQEPKVTVVRDGRKFLATIISSTFAGLNEGERQHMVWGHLLDELSDDDSALVEFVYADAPGEDAAEE